MDVMMLSSLGILFCSQFFLQHNAALDMVAIDWNSSEFVSGLCLSCSQIVFALIELTDAALCLPFFLFFLFFFIFCSSWCCVLLDPCWAILSPFIGHSLHVAIGMSLVSMGWARLHCYANEVQIYMLLKTNVHCVASVWMCLMDNNCLEATNVAVIKCKLNRSSINYVSIVFKSS